MLNKFRHKKYGVFTRIRLKPPLTMRESVNLVGSMDPEARENHNLCVSMNTCNPEEGEKTFNTKPRIVKHRIKRFTVKAKHLQHHERIIESIIRKNSKLNQLLR